MSTKVELRLSGAMDHLRLVWQTGETLLESVPFRDDPEGTRYNVLLAVQEMVTNVLRHAYGGREQEPVVVEFEVDERGVSVVLRDRGPEFNPVLIEAGPLQDERLPESEGGYGIMIAKMVMDDLHYARDGGWNALRMFKAAPAHAVARG